MDPLDYQASIIDARKAGKVVQIYFRTEWQDYDRDVFNFCVFKYRVKPEKLVRYIPVFKNQEGNHALGFAQTTEEKARNWRGAIDTIKVEYDPA
jgi:hypothetical protein